MWGELEDIFEDKTIQLVPSILLFQDNSFFLKERRVSQVMAVLSEMSPAFIFSFLGDNSITQAHFNQNLLNHFGTITKYFQSLKSPFYHYLQ